MRVFEGDLHVAAGEIPIRLEIRDWDFIDYPRILLRGYPAFLPEATPHRYATGGLCYFADGSVVLDRFDPAASVASCLRAAEELLETLITDPKRRRQDLQDEFQVYWASGPERMAALIGEIDLKASTARHSIIDLPTQRLNGSRVVVVSQSPGEVERLASSLDGKISLNQGSLCWLLGSSIPPVSPDGILPGTLKDLFSYLRRWDESLYRAVQDVLARDARYLNYTHIHFAIWSPAGWIGFSFELNPMYRTAYRRSPRKYRQYLHGKGGEQTIRRFSLSEVGTRFLHTRNIETPSLVGKRVILIGCGAIGGYLAQSLARMGAGSNGGVLRLVDPGYMEADNIGRHWLGMSSLFLPKAQAVASELARQFPESQFAAEHLDVRQVKGLWDSDLVIDATGVESVSEFLNAAHCRRNRPAPPSMLYIWVLGNGEAVQGLWVDSPKFGCYRCLRLPRGTQYRQERFPVLKHDPTFRYAGCREYRPYAVSAPMNAAALATEFVVDWLKQDLSPRFRSHLREGADIRKPKNHDFAPVEGCPACAR